MAIKPSSYIIALILFTIIILSGIFLINSFQESDSDYIDQTQFKNFNKTFNKYEELQNKSNTIKSQIENTPNQFGDLGVLNSLISSSWNTLQYINTSFGFISDIFNSFYTFFGIPAWVGNSLFLIIIISLSFAIFSAIFQREL